MADLFRRSDYDSTSLSRASAVFGTVVSYDECSGEEKVDDGEEEKESDVGGEKCVIG